MFSNSEVNNKLLLMKDKAWGTSLLSLKSTKTDQPTFSSKNIFYFAFGSQSACILYNNLFLKTTSKDYRRCWNLKWNHWTNLNSHFLGTTYAIILKNVLVYSVYYNEGVKGGTHWQILEIFLLVIWIQRNILMDFGILQFQQTTVSSFFSALIMDFACNKVC